MSVIRCIHCNYQLQQITAMRCPECGNDFDLANAESVNHGRELTHIARWSLAPAGRLAAVALIAAALLAIWFARLPPAVSDRAGLNGNLLLLLGFLWIEWSSLRRWTVRRNGWRNEWFVGARALSAAPGWFAIVVGLAVLVGLPQWAAFRLSEWQLNAIAQPMIGTKGKTPDQWAGLFHATSIHRVPDGVQITTDHDSEGDYGFIYFPNLDPKRPTWNSRQYVGDGWWTWQEPR